jgi:hypothetical protein
MCDVWLSAFGGRAVGGPSVGGYIFFPPFSCRQDVVIMSVVCCCVSAAILVEKYGGKT